jgi:hypothetical protein
MARIGMIELRPPQVFCLRAVRARLVLASIALSWAVLPAVASAGTEWRYCLATWEASRSVYVTLPFQSDAPLAALESAYSDYLAERSVKHDPPVCPRAESETQALAAREDAIAFNRTRGLSASLASWRYGD